MYRQTLVNNSNTDNDVQTLDLCSVKACLSSLVKFAQEETMLINQNTLQYIQNNHLSFNFFISHLWSPG